MKSSFQLKSIVLGIALGVCLVLILGASGQQKMVIDNSRPFRVEVSGAFALSMAVDGDYCYVITRTKGLSDIQKTRYPKESFKLAEN